MKIPIYKYIPVLNEMRRLSKKEFRRGISLIERALTQKAFGTNTTAFRVDTGSISTSSFRIRVRIPTYKMYGPFADDYREVSHAWVSAIVVATFIGDYYIVVDDSGNIHSPREVEAKVCRYLEPLKELFVDVLSKGFFTSENVVVDRKTGREIVQNEKIK